MISFLLLVRVVLLIIVQVQIVVVVSLIPVDIVQSYTNNNNNNNTVDVTRNNRYNRCVQQKYYHDHDHHHYHHHQYERHTIESNEQESNTTLTNNTNNINNNNSEYSYSYYYYDYYYIIVLNDTTTTTSNVYDAYYEIQQLLTTQVSIINNNNSTTTNSKNDTSNDNNNNNNSNNATNNRIVKSNTTNSTTINNNNSNSNTNTTVSLVTNLLQPYHSIKSMLLQLQIQIIIVSTSTSTSTSSNTIINDNNITSGKTTTRTTTNNKSNSNSTSTTTNNINNSTTADTTTIITEKNITSTIINNRNDSILQQYHTILLNAILFNNPFVLSIEEDQSFPISFMESTKQSVSKATTTTTTTTTTNSTTASTNSLDTSPTGTNISYQYNPLSWGLDRIDQLYLPLDKLYQYTNLTPSATATTGSTSISKHNNKNNVHVYIVGTGIDTNHTEFVRKTTFKNNSTSNTSTTKNIKIVDCINVVVVSYNTDEDNTNSNKNISQCFNITNGHDTHLAGIIGGITFGVAKQYVTITGLQVTTTPELESEEKSSSHTTKSTGTISSVLLGIEYILNKQLSTRDNNSKIIVILPIITTYSLALYTAINTLVQANVLVVIPAGNDNIDSCQVKDVSTTTKETTTSMKQMYPSGVMIVASTDKNDSKSYFSNWGSCIDLYAPGSDITSSWIIEKSISTSTGTRSTKNNTTKSISSTSIAAAYVSGVAVLYWSSEYYNTISLSSSKLITQIINDSTKGIVLNNTNNSPNVLVSMYNLLKLSNPNIINTTVLNDLSNNTTNETTTTTQLSSDGVTIITTYWYKYTSCWLISLVLLYV